MSDTNGYIPRGLLTVVAGITGIVPYLADWNETHIHNPNWPGVLRPTHLASVKTSLNPS